MHISISHLCAITLEHTVAISATFAFVVYMVYRMQRWNTQNVISVLPCVRVGLQRVNISSFYWQHQSYYTHVHGFNSESISFSTWHGTWKLTTAHIKFKTVNRALCKTFIFSLCQASWNLYFTCTSWGKDFSTQRVRMFNNIPTLHSIWNVLVHIKGILWDRQWRPPFIGIFPPQMLKIFTEMYL